MSEDNLQLRELTQAQKDAWELIKLLPPMEELMPPPEGKEDWVYRSIPFLAEHLWKDLFNNILGVDNVHFITNTARNFKDNPNLFIRGQCYISPAGMARLKEYNAAQKAQAHDSAKD